MSDEYDFISDLPEEPSHARLQGRAELRRVIRREQRRRRRQTWFLQTTALAAIIFVAWSLLPNRPAAQVQPLLGLADAVETLPPPTLGRGNLWYSRAERMELIVEEVDGVTVRFLRPEVREVWIGGAGTGRVVVTYGDPEFLSPQDRDTFYATGLADRYRTTTEEISSIEAADESRFDWSGNVRQLEAEMWRQVAGLGDPSREEAEMLRLAARLIRENEDHPERRSAVLRVIADLPGIQVTADGDTVGVSVDYDDGERPLRLRYEFDAHTAHLVGERVETRGDQPEQMRILRRAHYEPPRPVEQVTVERTADAVEEPTRTTFQQADKEG